MNITATEQIVIEYTQKLTSADLERYLADPWQWREDVQAQLGIQKSANGNGHKSGNGHAPAAATKRAAKGAGKRAASKRTPKGEKPLRQCPHCERTFKQQGRLNNHLASEHSSAPATAAAAA